MSKKKKKKQLRRLLQSLQPVTPPDNCPASIEVGDFVRWHRNGTPGIYRVILGIDGRKGLTNDNEVYYTPNDWGLIMIEAKASQIAERLANRREPVKLNSD